MGSELQLYFKCTPGCLPMSLTPHELVQIHVAGEVVYHHNPSLSLTWYSPDSGSVQLSECVHQLLSSGSEWLTTY
jgi:hypothetical protein